MANYLINMDDGRLVFRNSESDHHVNLKPVSDEIVAMIGSGELEAIDVVNAISAKIKENGDFNLSQYIEDLKRLNVRKSNPQKKVETETLSDRSGEEVSVDEVKTAKGKASAKEEKKARAKKANDAVESSLPDIFSK